MQKHICLPFDADLEPTDCEKLSNIICKSVESRHLNMTEAVRCLLENLILRKSFIQNSTIECICNGSFIVFWLNKRLNNIAILTSPYCQELKCIPIACRVHVWNERKKDTEKKNYYIFELMCDSVANVSIHSVHIAQWMCWGRKNSIKLIM